MQGWRLEKNLNRLDDPAVMGKRGDYREPSLQRAQRAVLGRSVRIVRCCVRAQVVLAFGAFGALGALGAFGEFGFVRRFFRSVA